MKILHVATGLQKASGVTTFVDGVVRALASLGHEVVVATLQTCSCPSKVDLKGCSVLHIHGIWSPWLHKWARIARKTGVPVVWSTHGMTAPWSLEHKWWKKCLYWWIVQKPDLKLAELVHSTVEKEREWNESWGLKRHVVAPLGTYLPRRTNVSRTPADIKTLLFVGRIYPVKAIDRLIEAFVRADVDGWDLRIVGPDQAGHMSELKDLVAGLGCEKVAFAGPKFGKDLESEYDNCDILALVSHTENFGATVVDAMAHGKPVITSTNTPWKEVADVGCGWWVDNDIDALAAALRVALNTPPGQLSIMGAKGRTLVESKYTWEAVAKKLEQAYRDITQGCEKGLCASCPNLYDTCSP